MFPIQIRPDEALNELHELGVRLGEGLETLTELGDIQVGASEREAVYREDKMVLYRFTPLREKLNPVPVLIVYALVNRPYMADLQEDRSLVRGLLEQGLDVYLIDWGYPDASDRYLNLDDYINGYIDHCVDHIREVSGQDRINLLGICQGGTFSLCYSALNPDKVRNLITTVTPVDFHTPDDMLSNWVRNIDIDLLVDSLGNIPGELLNWTFLSLKPYRLSGQKYLDMIDLLGDREAARNFMRMEKWIFDSPDQAGEAYREFIKQFYQQNGLIKGTVTIGDARVDLANVTMPVLNIFAAQDHLVPPASSKALERYIGTRDYTAIEFPGGHIGIYVSGRSMKTLPPAIGDWLGERT
ncbi:MAG: class III poly(R)-hydroxyalkanoic acid synthase subunit PhaC [Gammaproteobacteria bacterium]|nr:MAG: class III poly(R)-hydroxyalkanoic acid synthase subunit PhaC [Gammaproteobacteria bacterium]